MAYDVFISHASEDKETVARPLAARLRELGLKVWLDEFELTVGDNLRRVIDLGLSQSRFGVVILSPHFFEKDWPQQELNGLAAKEQDGLKVILPVWHNLTPQEVLARSPLLGGRLAVPTARGVEHVAREILRAVRSDSPTPPTVRQTKPAHATPSPPPAGRVSPPTPRKRRPLRWLLLAALVAVSATLFIYTVLPRWRKPNVNLPADGRALSEPSGPLIPGESFLKMQFPRQRQRTGTFCCVVEDGLGQHYILSSSFVISGAARDDVARVGPGGRELETVAILTRTIIPPSSRPEAAGGLARLGPDISVSSRIPRLGEIKGIAPPVKAGDLVRLWRPSIGAVEVPVRAVNARFQTGRYSRDEVEATFSGVIVIDDQVESGDTGAPVLDKDNKLVGLVLGRGFGGTAVAPIEPLLRAYNVSLTLTDVTPPGGQGGTPP